MCVVCVCVCVCSYVTVCVCSYVTVCVCVHNKPYLVVVLLSNRWPIMSKSTLHTCTSNCLIEHKMATYTW